MFRFQCHFIGNRCTVIVTVVVSLQFSSDHGSLNGIFFKFFFCKGTDNIPVT